MPKQTFYNLSEQKREKIIQVLKETFKNHPIFDANVKEIVEKLNIARGSFYQYFEDLEDAYFMILDTQTEDIHKIFIELLQKNDRDVFEALRQYGEEISKLIFTEDNYFLYKNRYLYWNAGLETGWNNYRSKNSSTISHFHTEEMEFTKAIVHNLIQRNFLNEWSREEFLEHYNQYIHWLKEGIDYSEIR